MSNEILIIDDNPDIRAILNDLLLDAGYSTRLAANYNQALKEIDKKLPDVAIIDVKLDKGDNDGIELLSHIKQKNKDIPVIIISGHANIEMAVKSLKSGAFEFIQKPFDKERLMNFIKRATENYDLLKQNKYLQTKLFHSFDLIGSSTNINKINDQIHKVASTDSRVFIYGPTGSGKELIARKIHKISNRKNKPSMHLVRTDLPEPDSPIIANDSDSNTLRSKSFSTTLSPNFLETLFILIFNFLISQKRMKLKYSLLTKLKLMKKLRSMLLTNQPLVLLLLHCIHDNTPLMK